jgi:tripartite-type tricarboxylate transporter receptor subunit TctC
VRQHHAARAATLTLFLAASLAAPTAAVAQAPSFPAKPVRIIVTTPAGSGADFFARTLAQGLTDAWQQQVVVENRPGAGGIIGAQALQQAPADGHTLGVASTAHIVAPLLQSKPPYRPLEDFTPIALLAAIPNVIIANRNVDANDAQDLVKLAKAQPGKLNFGSLGDGTAAHLGAEIFNRAAQLQVVHVPFKQVSDLYTALYSNDVQYAVLLVPSAGPALRSGKVRPVAVTSRTRNVALPDTPTVVELGLPAAESETLMGLIGPAGLPPAIVELIHRRVRMVTSTQDMRDRYAQQGAIPATDSTAAYATRLREEEALYRKLLPAIGLKPQ